MLDSGHTAPGAGPTDGGWWFWEWGPVWAVTSLKSSPAQAQNKRVAPSEMLNVWVPKRGVCFVVGVGRFLG